MSGKNYFLALSLVIFFFGCKNTTKSHSTATGVIPVAIDLAKVPDSWIDKRVEKSRAKLQGTAAGEVVWAAMEAHGGLSNWYKNGPVSFQFHYRPLDGGTPRNTYQVIDTWRSWARHKKVTDTTAQYGWKGKNAWVKAKDSTIFPYNMRFWSLTPYFFMGTRNKF